MLICETYKHADTPDVKKKRKNKTIDVFMRFHLTFCFIFLNQLLEESETESKKKSLQKLSNFFAFFFFRIFFFSCLPNCGYSSD